MRITLLRLLYAIELLSEEEEEEDEKNGKKRAMAKNVEKYNIFIELCTHTDSRE